MDVLNYVQLQLNVDKQTVNMNLPETHPAKIPYLNGFSILDIFIFEEMYDEISYLLVHKIINDDDLPEFVLRKLA